MNEISALALVELATDLTASLVAKERYDRLLDTVRKTISSEAVALLSFHVDGMLGGLLKPIAMQGLTRDTLGRRFVLSDHPRLEVICSSYNAIRFPSDCNLPDPYDGLLIDREGDLPVHACMGLPLYFGDVLLGVLTLDSLNEGAFDDIPQRTLEMVASIAAATLNTALMIEKLESRAKYSQQVVYELTAMMQEDGELVGESPVMQRLKREISIAAPSDFTVLIHGETGVGKELVARSLYNQSKLTNKPLVYVNCAALPETLIESELFGHVKGAFTGALKDRLGKFAMADGGTIFLDEIGELPFGAQSKLLRALQSKEIQPVGQDEVKLIDVRVLAATNRDLQLEVKEGRFRADLYHRLSVYPIEVPSLRGRYGDVPLLAGYFIEQVKRKLGFAQLKMSHKVIQAIEAYEWPGNVRELQHVINRSALKAGSSKAKGDIVVIEMWHCSELNALHSERGQAIEVLTDDAKVENGRSVGLIENNSTLVLPTLREATDLFQKRRIMSVIDKHAGNWAAASRELGVDRGNLSRIAKRLGVVMVKTVKED